jgi:hypothetical protein
MEADKQSTAYPPLTPQQAAEELGVPLSQRLLPDFSAAVPKRFVTLEEAKARGWSWYRDGATGACRYGHDNTARRTANPKICSDCERVKEGKEPIYGTSRVRKFYDKPRKPDPTGAVVIQAPAAAPAQEMPKKDHDFLTCLAETGSFEAACEQTKVSRGHIEARASASETFAKPLNDLCDRLQIPRTLKSAAAFAWSDGVERNLIRHFINGGLLHTAREAVGLSASEYFAHLDSSPAFAAAIEAARPLALETLKDRSLHAASVGNERLFKLLTDGTDDETKSLSLDQAHAELSRLIDGFVARGVIKIDHVYRHAKTGTQIDLREYEPVDDSNADLVS